MKLHLGLRGSNFGLRTEVKADHIFCNPVLKLSLRTSGGQGEKIVQAMELSLLRR